MLAPDPGIEIGRTGELSETQSLMLSSELVWQEAMASHARKRKEGSLIRLLHVLEFRHIFLGTDHYSMDKTPLY